MGRKPGFKMSDEQKAAMAEGRRKALAAKREGKITVDEPLIAKVLGMEATEKPKRILTPEHLAKIQEGRRLARERKIANGEPLRVVRKKNKREAGLNDSGNPIVYITGKEKECFDFYIPLRDALRPLRKYKLLEMLERKIRDAVYWQNVEWVKNQLSSFVELRVA